MTINRPLEIPSENRTALIARIKQRVQECLPENRYTIRVQEVACADTGCPVRTTIISAIDEQGRCRRWAIHAPMHWVTISEIERVLKV
jgi:hypothetical protein